MSIDKNLFLQSVPIMDVLTELKYEVVPDKDNTWVTVKCPNPHHADKNPSCRVNVETKIFKCFGCDTGGDIITFVQYSLGFDKRQKAVEWLSLTFKLAVAKLFNAQLVHSYHERLLQSDALVTLLLEKKGIEKNTIVSYKLGYDGQRITIPIWNEFGQCLNVRRYLPGAKFNKFISSKGYPGKALYPISSLETDTLCITEGELKALLLIQNGFPAVSSISGANTWEKEWSGYFLNKTVYLIFDIDRAGKLAAQKVGISIIDGGAKEVRIIDLPLSAKKYPTGDITNFFVDEKCTTEELTRVINESKIFRPLSGREVLLKNEEITDVSLFEIARAIHTGKRVRASGIIQAKDRDEYIVPKRIRIDCKKDHLECAVCPVGSNIEANGEFDLNLEDLVTIQFIDKPTSTQTQIIREAVGIPLTCKKNIAVPIETENVQDIRVIPEESLTNPNDDTLCRIFSIGYGLKANEKYTFEARVWPHPDTQAATAISYNTYPAVDGLGNFALQNGQFENLSIFRPDSEQTPQEKLDEIYHDLSENVTKIYQRPLLHMFMDIVWHSALYLEIEEKRIKGWIDGVIVGDPAQGKSEVAENLLRHYKTGTRIDTKGASVPGLLGVCEQIGTRWMVRWGKIPINDRRLVILEECKGMPQEVIAKLTDMRSSGMAEITKAGNQRTYARTRQLWISNPRDNISIKGHNYGIYAIQNLIGASEDLRRFDMAMCVATGEIDAELLNRPKNKSVCTTNRYTSDLCHSLVLWCWSRTADHILFSDDSINELYAATRRVSERYSANIPLVEPADQRYKIARIATAIAGRLFSTVDGVSLNVFTSHIQCAEQFLYAIYDNPIMGYDLYSASEKAATTLINESDVRDALTELGGFLPDFIQGCLRQAAISTSDLMDLTGGDRDEAKNLIGLLVRNNAIVKMKHGYVKRPKFIELLRAMNEDGYVPEKKKEMF